MIRKFEFIIDETDTLNLHLRKVLYKIKDDRN